MFGKGFFIWQLVECADGDPAKLADMAIESSLDWVAIKVADGIYPYNIQSRSWFLNDVDLVVRATEFLREAGIKVYGWHYLYGNYPTREAQIAVERVNELKLDGYIMDVERPYKGKHTQARTFVEYLMDYLTVPIGLASYRYPSYHPSIPWAEFLSVTDVHVPQVYWQGNTNESAPSEQLQKSYDELIALKEVFFSPIGAAYSEHGWKPTPEQQDNFHLAVLDMGLDGISWWSWQHAERTGWSEFPLTMWQHISTQFWTPDPSEPEEPQKLVIQCNMVEVIGPYGLNIRSEPKYGSEVVGYLSTGERRAVRTDVTEGDDYYWLEIPGEGFIAWKHKTENYVFIEYVYE